MRIHGVLNFIFLTFGLAVTARPLPVLFEQQGAGTYGVRGNGYAIAIGGDGMALATATGTEKLAWVGANGVPILPLEPLAWAWAWWRWRLRCNSANFRYSACWARQPAEFRESLEPT